MAADTGTTGLTDEAFHALHAEIDRLVETGVREELHALWREMAEQKARDGRVHGRMSPREATVLRHVVKSLRVLPKYQGLKRHTLEMVVMMGCPAAWVEEARQRAASSSA